MLLLIALADGVRDAHEALAHCRLHARIPEAARGIAQGAQNPLQPYRLFMRSVARFCGKNFEGAERDAAAGGDLRPNEAGHLKMRALALKELRKTEEADACLVRAAQLSSKATMTTKPPVVPPDCRWILEKLKPQSG